MQNIAPLFLIFSPVSDTEERFREFCVGLSHSLHRKPFPMISLGCLHHLPITTKYSYFDFNMDIKDCNDLIT